MMILPPVAICNLPTCQPGRLCGACAGISATVQCGSQARCLLPFPVDSLMIFVCCVSHSATGFCGASCQRLPDCHHRLESHTFCPIGAAVDTMGAGQDLRLPVLESSVTIVTTEKRGVAARVVVDETWQEHRLRPGRVWRPNRMQSISR